MDAIDAIRTRRTVRRYREETVPRALIEELIADATHAPFTPIAREGAWWFTVIEGRDRVAEYGARALAYAREHRPQLRGYEWTKRADFSVFHGAPLAVVISGREALSVGLEECTRAGQILDIAAWARGLGTCWVGSPLLWLRDPEVRDELRIPSGWLPHAPFAVGYPARDLPPPVPVSERPPLQIDWL